MTTLMTTSTPFRHRNQLATDKIYERIDRVISGYSEPAGHSVSFVWLCGDNSPLWRRPYDISLLELSVSGLPFPFNLGYFRLILTERFLFSCFFRHWPFPLSMLCFTKWVLCVYFLFSVHSLFHSTWVALLSECFVSLLPFLSIAFFIQLALLY